MSERIMADVIVREVARKSGFTICHVRNMLRKYRRELSARQLESGRWTMPESGSDALLKIVRTRSGLKKKLGERNA